MIKWILTLFLSLVLIWIGGCATPPPVIENGQVRKNGFYQIAVLPNDWLRSSTRIIEYWGGNPATMDLVYFKCPGNHSIYLLTAILTQRTHNLSRGFFFWNHSSFEERMVALYEDMNPSVKQILSHRTISIKDYLSVEIVYFSKNNGNRPGEFCTTGKPTNESLRVKDIVINAGWKPGFGQGHEVVILSYA